MSFSPVAIVGQGCVLPGAMSSAALWEAVAQGRDLTTPVPEGAWPVDPLEIMGADGGIFRDGERPVPSRGGFVSGFGKIFDPSGFQIPVDDVNALDRSVQWLLEAARQAVRDARYDTLAGIKAAVILGNNSYPTASLVDIANRALIEEPLGVSTLPSRDTVKGRRFWANRFSSGRPAHMLARALAAEGPAFCLDAACASSLYAVKIACDYLQDGTADVVLSGGLCGTDNIFLHLGFSEIRALSPSGMSRPFHRSADGLLPAEGAGVLVLKRLEDAVCEGDMIHGVIRGIGLSNDGRRGGLLAPDKDGQIAALRQAYEVAGIVPTTISLLECHATGTSTGDRVELESAQSVFGQTSDLPVGSLKSNLGHLITAAGVGSIIKVTGAMARGQRPPTLHAEEPLVEFDDTPLRPLHVVEPWPDEHRRRAGVSNFGFGGNNAHLILEEFSKDDPIHVVKTPQVDDPIVICGVGLIAGNAVGLDQFAQRLFASESAESANRIAKIEMPLEGMKFPPADLQQCLAQQTSVLEACRLSVDGVAAVDPNRCGVVIGMGCDVDATRPGLRYRLGKAIERAGASLRKEEQDALLAAIGGLAGAGHVIGAMPNLPANRINVFHDWRGPSCTVACEELSGLTALEIAARALRDKELDMAIAGAVDLSDEPVHRLACEAILAETMHCPADTAIVFALKRRTDAEAAGDRILAAVEIEPSVGPTADESSVPANSNSHNFGHAHAAAAMVQAAAMLAAASAGVELRSLRPQMTEPRTASVTTRSFTGQSQRLALRDVAPIAGFGVRPDAPYLFFAAADSLSDLRAALVDQIPSSKGSIRIAIAAANQLQLENKIAATIRLVDEGKPVILPGVRFGHRPHDGDVAFMYPGTAAGYPGMAETLALAFPEVTAKFRRQPGMQRVSQFYSEHSESSKNLAQAAAMAFVGSFGTSILRDHLGVMPSVALGVSIGEVSMLAANEVWRDPEPILDGLESAQFYERLSGDHPTVARCLNLESGTTASWENHEIIAPVEQVEAAIHGVSNVWITIVSSPNHCAIGGTAEGCAAVSAQFQPDAVIRFDIGFAFHGPFAEAMADSYQRAHTQPVSSVEGMRFYFNATHDVVAQESDKIAECLRYQMLNRVDFRPTVEKAWADGVRVFVDVGPRSTLVGAIKAILGDRPHVVVGLDSQRRDGLLQLADTAAALFAAGLPVDLSALSTRLVRLRGEPEGAGASLGEKKLVLSAHLPPVLRQPFEMLRERMPAVTNGKDTSTKPFVIPKPPSLPGPRYQIPERNTAPSDGTITIPFPPDDVQIFPGGPETQAGDAVISAGVVTALPVNRKAPKRVNGAGTQPAKVSSFDAAAMPVQPIEVLEPTGPAFDRKQLETLAGGKISSVFGSPFEQQDGYVRQCRMPQPPLLLADRVLGISGEPGSMGKGVCWTETDIERDAWYLHNGTMPTGLVIESGQADLLLISWLGADFLNRDERVYRLLGCEITFHDGPLPRAGETLRFQIHVDGHATLGETRMFFFRYDARIGDQLVSSVRSGQAGFFSDAELTSSGGVLWSAETDAPKADARCDPAPNASAKRAFSSDDLRAFSDGDAYSCFGSGFERAAAHSRTPTIPSGRMRLIDRVSEFDPTGGPWGRGYLKAEYDVPTDAWFYGGHFKNDPCMPGTLMADAAAQALGVHMAGLGFSVDRDGWVFRPVTGEVFKFVCRGQVIPDRPHMITYEIFVEEIVDGEEPTIYAALLARSDGHKVFLCRRFGIKLVRDWPLYTQPEFLEELSEARIVSPSGDVPGDHKALLACAWGKPSDAFGSMYRRFDSESSIPRLPSPPYHCISRIVSIDCDPGKQTPGGKLVSEFDIDPRAWYFADGGNGAMPFSVLTEVLLQPCGWLASYMGFALAGDLKLRNLDGNDVLIEREVGPDTGKLTVEATFTKSAVAGPTSIVFYEITCHSPDGHIVRLKTDFGLFPAEALVSQKGLPVTDERRNALSVASAIDPRSLVSDPLANDVCAGSPTGRLAMLDCVTGFWPEGGKAGLGRVTGIQSIDPASWYFKAHFFDDPVQPGSLGLEALFSLLKAITKLKGLHENFAAPRFEAPAIGASLGWKYRGQVIPTNKNVITEIDILDIKDEGETVLITAEGSLWVDGLRIYEVSNYSVRIGEGKVVAGRPASEKDRRRPTVDLTEWVVDLDACPWLKDHCPTFSIPVYPMMAVAGDLLDGKGRNRVTALADVELGSWLRLDQGPVTLSSKTFTMPDGRTNRQLFRRIAGKDKRIGRAVETETDKFPASPVRWDDQTIVGEVIDPYRSGELFHNGAFEIARELRRSDSSSRFVFDAGDAWRRAEGHPAILLDAMVHGIPHWQPSLLFGAAASDFAAFPYRLETLQLFSALPIYGEIVVLTRALNMPTPRTIRLEVQALSNGTVIVEFTLMEVLVPLGGYQRLSPDKRRSFVCGRQFEEGWAVADLGEAGTTLSRDTVREVNWLPGTLEALYGLPFDGSLDEKALTEQIAIKDHFATRHRLHPSSVTLLADRILPGDASPVFFADLSVGWIDDDTFRISRDHKGPS